MYLVVFDAVANVAVTLIARVVSDGIVILMIFLVKVLSATREVQKHKDKIGPLRTENSVVTNDHQKMSDILNSYLYSVFTRKILTSLPKPNITSLEMTRLSELMRLLRSNRESMKD
ncbi:hypothetical protein HELRODRAFT_168869 [Helobdella robusta]|uniref:Uncharacterized protein n=1 Tax=Helobdella robusta TaxID=6412 RepID=T1F127_HELRO|nr:hypothetical protein HELRODRAFT_168869 [Helobdella robusta]ESO08947.1 hypothetical protein HELRODRAFT_168869 [Helobdella robusta]